MDALEPTPDAGLRETAAAPAAATREREAQRAQLTLLAQEFEALLMNELLGEWRRSLVEGSEEGDADDGMGTMVDMVGSEFGRALAKSGGLGITAQLLRAFDRQLTGADSHASLEDPIKKGMTGEGVQGRSAAGNPAGLVAAIASAAAVAPTAAGRGPLLDEAPSLQPLGGRVTSGFGLRRDPFNGQVKFHAGADIRMAYGAEVASVAPGRVSFAGDQSGYGLTVVIDHANGLQTRYAHLSSVGVEAGEAVRAGQVVARSGNSGRSTGAHLHIELLREGRPVDPSVLLKDVKGGADWKAYRSAWAGSAQGPRAGDQE
ncbi:MAG: peptidoglycan DD-metalloendopeptidase family protein [Vicinamibacterales bacterium]